MSVDYELIETVSGLEASKLNNSASLLDSLRLPGSKYKQSALLLKSMGIKKKEAGLDTSVNSNYEEKIVKSQTLEKL